MDMKELQARVCELRVALETQTLRVAKSEEKVAIDKEQHTT